MHLQALLDYSLHIKRTFLFAPFGVDFDADVAVSGFFGHTVIPVFQMS